MQPNKQYADIYEEHIEKHNKFSFFKEPFKPYVHESSANKYAIFSYLAFISPLMVKYFLSWTQMFSLSSIASLSCYFWSVFFIFKFYYKFKEYNFSQGKTPLSKVLKYGIIAALLVSIPDFFLVQNGTLFSADTICVNPQQISETYYQCQ